MRQDLTLFTSHILLIIYTRAREGHKRGAESMTDSSKKIFFVNLSCFQHLSFFFCGGLRVRPSRVVRRSLSAIRTSLCASFRIRRGGCRGYG